MVDPVGGGGQRGHLSPPNRSSFPLFYTVFSQFWNFLFFFPDMLPCLPKISPGSTTG